MAQRNDRWQKFRKTEGPTIPVPSSVSALGFHFAAMRSSLPKIGSVAWRTTLLNETRSLAQPELIPIIGTMENPINPFKVYVGSPKDEGRVFQKCPNPDWVEPAIRKYPAKHFHGKIEAAISILEKCDPEFTSFLTVVTDVCTDYQVAYESIERSKKQFQQLLNRRFPGHIALIFFESIQKQAKDVDRALIPNNAWARGISDNRIVYVNHFHGVVFTPGVRRVDLADAIRINPNGKRSSLYSGSNQVHVQPLRQVLEAGKTVLDVRGVSGYSTKNHFKPIVTDHQLEGFPEWLLIQDQIVNNSGSLLISGMRKLDPYSGSRPTLARLRKEMQRQWNRLTLTQRAEEAIVDHTDVELALVSKPSEPLPVDQHEFAPALGVDSLNSVELCIWRNLTKRAQKKLSAFLLTVARVATSALGLHQIGWWRAADSDDSS